MLTNEMSQPLRTACEAIYSEFKGYWPNDSECARLQCAIDAALRAEHTRKLNPTKEQIRAAAQVLADSAPTFYADEPLDEDDLLWAERALIAAASVEETP